MLTPLPKQTIFERRRQARRDRVLLLAALLGGQLFFFGMMAWALKATLMMGQPDAAAWVPYGLLLGSLAWALQTLYAFWGRGDAPGVPLQAPDTDDERHQAWRRQAQAVALATGLSGVQPMVVASTSLNAFSCLDSEGRPLIGITEGLLARLEGPELQAVAAHQATHLAYDDARFLSFAGSSMALFEALSRTLGSLRLRGAARGGRSSGGGRGGGGAVVLAWLSLWGLAFVASLAMRGLYILFARGRKLHADAGAVAMTRDPLALASALDKAARGGGAGLELPPSLAPLRLVGSLAEEQGSHPDPQLRLRWLVADAGQSLRHFSERQRLAAAQSRRRVLRKDAPPRFWLHQGGAWAGPWALGQLLSKGLSGDSWVSPEGGQAVQRAAALPELGEALKRQGGRQACPRCLTPLRPRRREGVSLRHCPHCDGHAVSPAVLRRLIARREEAFGLSTHKAALRLRRQGSAHVLAGLDQACGFPPLLCPECQGPTQKRFYDHVAHVPVDVCINPRCGQLWLDGGELELIQLLHEEPSLGLDKASGRPKRRSAAVNGKA